MTRLSCKKSCCSCWTTRLPMPAWKNSLLKEIAEKHKEKVVVISLSVDPEPLWKETEVKESADNWLQLSDGLGMSGIAARYGVHALPTFIYISPESTVLKAGQGYKFLSEDIRTFIKDK